MKKIFTIFLALIMCLGTVSGAYAAGKNFTDVKTTDWFYSDVQKAVELGLVNGKTATTYEPNSKLTYAEAIKLAACMHQLYTIGSINIKAGNPWYIPYVEYCEENGIITKAYNFAENATRAGYMEIFANALPGDGLEAINKVADNAIPDVPSSANYAPGVYKLYRAGILQGVDAAHNCSPLNNITRSEVAAILTRMMDKEKRVKFTLGDVEEEIKEETKEEKVEPLKFKKNPIGGSLDVGGTIVTNIEVSGGVKPYSYQWQYDDGSGWKNVSDALGKVSGETGVKVSIKATKAASYKVRCVVIDSKGNSAFSEETEFSFTEKEKLKITKQPEGATITTDFPLSAMVEVEGGKEPYEYHWVIDADGKWFSLKNALGATGADTKKLTVMASDATTMTVRCIIKDAAGASVESEIVNLVFNKAPKAELEPLKVKSLSEDTEIKTGESTTFEVEVEGGSGKYSYKWYIQTGKEWNTWNDNCKVEGTNTPVLTVTGSAVATLKFFCEIKDSEGNKVLSDIITLNVVSGEAEKLPLAIETQPVETKVSVGTDAVLSVKAVNGSGDYTYQWQMSIGPSYVRMSDNELISGTTTDTLTLKATAASFIDVRCVVTDSEGARVESEGVRVTFE